MLITEYSQNNVVILTLDGRLDSVGTDVLATKLEQYCHAEYPSVILEMSAVQFINSSGLRLLVRYLKISKERGCVLRLAGLTHNVERAIDLVGLIPIIKPYPTLQAAIADH